MKHMYVNELGHRWFRSWLVRDAMPLSEAILTDCQLHDDVIKWKHFPRHWPFVRGIHRSPVNSPHKGQWRGALMFILICARINGWVNNREAGDLRRRRVHYDVIVMEQFGQISVKFWSKFTHLHWRKCVWIVCQMVVLLSRPLCVNKWLAICHLRREIIEPHPFLHNTYGHICHVSYLITVVMFMR